jgi:hypothetical protein
MSLLRRTLFALPAAVGLVSTVARSAAALPPVGNSQRDRTLFSWTGTVDREVMLVIRGRNVQARATGVDASFPSRVDMRDDLPRDAGGIAVHLENGRGDVEVVQQPSARNDYTAIVRVYDGRSGADQYRVVASWQPMVVDVRDRDRDRDRNDDYDRDNRGNRDGGWDRGRNDDRRDDPRDDNRRDDGRGRDAGRLSWSGAVDDVAEVRIQGRRVEFRTRSGQVLRDVRYDVRGGGLPDRPVALQLDVSHGRGSVEVIQTPNPFNGFTAVIRLVDRRAGYGDYDFDLRWN